MLRFAAILFFVAASLSSNSAKSWKVDAHIWIAQEILNDAQDGYLEVKLNPGKTYLKLSSDVAAALKLHPKAFLLGSIGPDAFPDALTGQLVVHPGIPTGWGVSEWLQHLLYVEEPTLEQTAFALGYFSHAAADVFAHTFVNRYAGDVFELFAHPDAALRHIYVESFVSNYLPPVVDKVTGAHYPNAATAVRTGTHLPLPSEFIRDRLILHPAAVEQYAISGNAPHLVAAVDHYEWLQRILAEDGLVSEIEEAIKRYIIEAKLAIELSDETLAVIIEYQQKLHELGNDITEDGAELLSRLAAKLNALQVRDIGFAQAALKVPLEQLAKIEELQHRLLQTGVDLNKIRRRLAELSGLPKTISECANKCDWPLCKYDPRCDVCRLVCEEVVNPTLAVLWEQERNLEKKILKWSDDRRTRVEKLPGVVDEAFDVIYAAQKMRHDSVIAFLEFLRAGPVGDPHRRRLEQFRSSIPIALEAWTIANAETIIRSVDPDADSTTEPLTHWLRCYGPVFLNIPVFVTEGACSVAVGVEELVREFEQFEAKLLELHPLTAKLAEIKQQLTVAAMEIRTQIGNQAVEESLAMFDEIAKTKTLDMFKGLTERVDAAAVDRIFSEGGADRLLIIPEASKRLIAEMAVDGQTFDVQKFAAMHNSIALSKLAMLDRPGLVDLAESVGISSSLFGKSLYGSEGIESENILFGFLRNIDGNHQWLDLAPPHPRADGYDVADFKKRGRIIDPASPDFARYGYSDASCSLRQRRFGMRLWADPAARNLLFERLFRGDIAAGIDCPYTLGSGFSSVLHRDYPRFIHCDARWLFDTLRTARGKKRADEWLSDGSRYYRSEYVATSDTIYYFDRETTTQTVRDFIGEFTGSNPSGTISVLESGHLKVEPDEGGLSFGRGVELHRARTAERDVERWFIVIPTYMLPQRFSVAVGTFDRLEMKYWIGCDGVRHMEGERDVSLVLTSQDEMEQHMREFPISDKSDVDIDFSNRFRMKTEQEILQELLDRIGLEVLPQNAVPGEY